ncbi:putative capsular polysaccharide synthesis family protein [Leptothoe sp. ISB3NOV94-8A]|nr:putative capsular polysaccharide synthesis family protein [Leptothoe sp. LEGE 181152]
MALSVKGKLIQWLIKKNFHLSNFYEQFKVAKADTKANKILIYQMGKVASTSLHKTLKNRNLDASIYHLHTLQPASIHEVKQAYKKRFLITHRVDEHLIHSQYLRRCLDRGLNDSKSKWKIITLVRDPVARNISKFFQENRYNSEFNALLNDFNVEALIQKYFHHYLDEKHPFTWFDEELSPVFSIDNPLNDFSKTDGFKIYSYDHVDLLVLKVEHLDHCVEEAFSKFLNINNVSLVKANVAGKRKEQGKIYKQFKQHINFPPEYLDRLYRSPQVEKIYSEAEIQGFYRQWQVAQKI